MGNPAWKDPIIEEVRNTRKEIDKELKKDARGFIERAMKHARELGFKISPLKPVRPKLEKKRKIVSR